MIRRDLVWKGNERMIAIGHHYAFTLYFSIRSHDALSLTKHLHVKILILARQNPRRWGVWVTSWADCGTRACAVTDLPWVETGLTEWPPRALPQSGSSTPPSGPPPSTWATSLHRTLQSTDDPPRLDSSSHLPLNSLKTFRFPSHRSCPPPFHASTTSTPTPFTTSTKFFPHNSGKTMSSRKQMGIMWQLKALIPEFQRLRGDKQTQRKFLKSRTTYASSCL